jgi:hypothetical protein
MNKIQWGKYRHHTHKSISYVMAWIGMCVGLMVIAYGITTTLVDFGRETQQYKGAAAQL